MVERHVVCPASELGPGERRIIDVGGYTVGVFNVGGEFHALRNCCPHQLAPLCEGQITGTTVSDTAGEFEWKKDGEVIRCPWHGWEFDITNGESVFNPHRRVRTYDVEVESADDVECHIEGSSPPLETFETDVQDGMVVVYA